MRKDYEIPNYSEKEQYILPEYVPKEGNFYQLGLRYAHFIAPIVKSIQELSYIVNKQQKQIDDLKKIINTLINK